MVWGIGTPPRNVVQHASRRFTNDFRFALAGSPDRKQIWNSSAEPPTIGLSEKIYSTAHRWPLMQIKD
jgi:hypothetical protein